MKFGQQLKRLTVQDWKDYYINYKRLKDVLKSFIPESTIALYGKQENNRNLKETHIAFFDQLQEEVDKVEIFYSSQLRMYTQKLDSLKLQYYDKMASGSTSKECQDHLKGLSEQANRLSQDVALFNQYIQVNRTAVRKIIKKHDKLTFVPTKDTVLDTIKQCRIWFECEALRDLTIDTEKFLSEVCRQIVRRYFVS